jgi:hypothetical protein
MAIFFILPEIACPAGLIEEGVRFIVGTWLSQNTEKNQMKLSVKGASYSHNFYISAAENLPHEDSTGRIYLPQCVYQKPGE